MADLNKKDTINYIASIDSVETLDAAEKKTIKIKGTLMNNAMNANGWKVRESDLKTLAEQVSGIPIKVQHASSDWEIIGEGTKGTVDITTNSVKFEANITDPKAVEKFDSGTWSIKNMGVSPSVSYAGLNCSICGKSAKTCSHIPNKKYGDHMAGVITDTPKLIEISTTSNPAYKDVGAGIIETISSDTLIASINNNVNTEGKLMTEIIEKESLVAQIAQKDAEITSSKEKINEMCKKIEEMIKEMKTISSSMEAQKNEFAQKEEAHKETQRTLMDKIKESETVIASLKMKTRTAELETFITDKELVAEMLKSDMTDEQFSAEVSKAKKLLATRTVGSNGSAPLDASIITDTFKAEFGASKNDMIKRIFG